MCRKTKNLFSKLPQNNGAFGTKDSIRTVSASLSVRIFVFSFIKLISSAYRLYVLEFCPPFPSFLHPVHVHDSILHRNISSSYDVLFLVRCELGRNIYAVSLYVPLHKLVRRRTCGSRQTLVTRTDPKSLF